MSDLELLIRLCELGAHPGHIRIPLRELSKALSCSNQTAARKLEKLAGRGLIERRRLGRTQTVRITEKGMAYLKDVKTKIESALEGRQAKLKIRGRVVDGFGEGRYYMSQKHYRTRFKEELGFAPYPGTLDIKVEERESLENLELLKRAQGSVVEGFTAGKRTFGSVKFFRGSLNRTAGAVVFPERGHHKDVVEFIAAKNLRQALGLKNGDQVEVEVWL